jgi:hypothetical protein
MHRLEYFTVIWLVRLVPKCVNFSHFLKDLAAVYVVIFSYVLLTRQEHVVRSSEFTSRSAFLPTTNRAFVYFLLVSVHVAFKLAPSAWTGSDIYHSIPAPPGCTELS